MIGLVTKDVQEKFTEDEEEVTKFLEHSADVSQTQADLGLGDVKYDFSRSDGDTVTPHRNSNDACLLKRDQGSCQDYNLKWYFDTTKSKCSPFWYGGCGGNRNRFETLEACEGFCLRRRQ
ncbi:hypothetical protein UPYG_G00155460 [Umbra pygmaea]|uniref:BPTI/Kunitz inhibitor domain-containing protein n=1 Tax=Umbra pygmaea TaxID=75934 RepID=A0ABD0WZA9_UMBPY